MLLDSDLSGLNSEFPCWYSHRQARDFVTQKRLSTFGQLYNLEIMVHRSYNSTQILVLFFVFS